MAWIVIHTGFTSEQAVVDDIIARIKKNDNGDTPIRKGYCYATWPDCQPWLIYSALNKHYGGKRFSAQYSLKKIDEDSVGVGGTRFIIWRRRYGR